MSGGALLFFWAIALCYMIQFIVAIRAGTEPVDKLDGKSIASSLFEGQENFRKTWVTVAMIFIIPVLVSWSSSIFDRILDIKPAGAVFFGCLSMLFVLVTLELSVLNGLKDEHKDSWRGLLIFALVLDILSILVFVAVLKPVAYPVDQQSGLPVIVGQWDGLVFYIGMLGVCALISSFVVVLFTIGANRNNV